MSDKKVVPENIALKMLDEGASKITEYCRNNGISDKDQVSLRALHSSEIAHKTGYQMRTTTQLLDDLLNDRQTREAYQTATIQEGSNQLAALIIMSEDKGYAQKMLDLYHKEIEPQLSKN